ncbi:hypothetical protein D3C76_1526120 [compost metagenome]
MQFSEGGFVVIVFRQFDLSQACRYTLGEINSDLYLANQWEHIRVQASLQEDARINVFRRGVSFGLVQNITQGVEHLLENRNRSGIQGNGHSNLDMGGGKSDGASVARL